MSIEEERKRYGWWLWLNPKFVFRSADKEEYTKMSEMDRALAYLAGAQELNALLVLHGLLLICWQIMGMATGFCPINVVPFATSSVTAVCHTGFWIVLSWSALAVGIYATGYQLWIFGEERTFAKDAEWTRFKLLLWAIITGLDLAANAIHLILTAGFEIAHSNSTLVTNPGQMYILILFCVLLGLLIVLEIIEIYRGGWYFRQLIGHVNEVAGGVFNLVEENKPIPRVIDLTPKPLGPIKTGETAPAAGQISHGLRIKLQ